MKLFKLFAASLLACAALLFTSCEKGVTNTGDLTGNIYGIWQLDSKTVNRETEKVTDFTSEHFYLCLNSIRMAFGKTLDHVDVDFSWYSYNDQKHQISFDKSIVLMQGLKEVMSLSGTYDVTELSKDKLVITKEVGSKITTYVFHKIQQQQQSN